MIGQVKGLAEIETDCRKWEGDHLEWQAAIDGWRRDHQQFVEDLSRVRDAVEEYRYVLETHASAVAAHNSRLGDHGQSLRRSEGGEEGGGLRESFVDIHRENKARHERQRRLHERIRRHHEAVKEALAKLKAAAEAL